MASIYQILNFSSSSVVSVYFHIVVRMPRHFHAICLRLIFSVGVWIHQRVTAFNNWQVLGHLWPRHLVNPELVRTYVLSSVLLVLVLAITTTIIIRRCLNHAVIALHPDSTKAYILLNGRQFTVFSSWSLRCTNLGPILGWSGWLHYFIVVSARWLVV